MVVGTHENIINAFFKISSQNPNRENITLSDIAREAGISRQAIYAKHFSCIEDIRSEIFHSIDDSIYNQFEKMLNKYSESKDIYEIISISIIPEIYNKRDWIKVLYNTSSKPRWELFLEDRYIELFLQYFEYKIKPNTFLSTLDSIDITCQFILSIFSIWLASDFPEPPAVFSKKFISTMGFVNLLSVGEI